MFQAKDIFDDAKDIFGICREEKLFRWMTDAIRMLANKGDIDPLVGALDICVQNKCVTLPREVETVLGVNLAGRPALGHNELFSFHLNGPGDCKNRCDYSWFDELPAVTYKDIICPGRLVAFVDKPEDSGVELRVFGFDNQNKPLQTLEDGVWTDGLLVPTIFGYAVPASTDPLVSRITDIVKGPSAGIIRLSTYDNSSSSGTLIGIYDPDETHPRYRRIKISRGCPWVRIVYRKKSFDITSLNTRILLHSRFALVMAMKAVKFYLDSDVANGMQFEAHASRILTEQEGALVSPNAMPMQVEDRNSIMQKDDWNVD
jgi:hypothetical protein